MKFNMKKYLLKQKEQRKLESENDKIKELQKLRTLLIIEDLKHIAENEEIEKMEKNLGYNFSDSEMEIVKVMAEEFDISLQDAMALTYAEAILIEKKEAILEEEPDAIVIDVYELILEKMYSYKDEDEDEKNIYIVTLYELEEEKEFLFI